MDLSIRDTLTARVNLAQWIGDSGDPAGAQDLLAGLLPNLDGEFGADHPFTLAARGNLAHWTGETGDIVGARDMFAALLPELEQVLGTQHPATLSCRGNLARWTGETGDPARARDLYAELASIREQVLGPDDLPPLAPARNSPPGPAKPAIPRRRGTWPQRCCRTWNEC